jgi:hypothetical protein
MRAAHSSTALFRNYLFGRPFIGRPSAVVSKQEQPMASSGPIRQFYGVVIRDKCKTSDLDTLMAYKTVAEDLLKDHDGPDAKDLADAVKDLDKVIAAKRK